MGLTSKDLQNIVSTIIGTAPNYMFIKDSDDDFRYLYSSPSNDVFFRAIFNSKLGNIVGHTDFELFENQELAASFRDSDIAVLLLKPGEVKKNTELIPDREGKVRTVEIIRTIIVREDAPPFILGNCLDVTEVVKNRYKLMRDNTSMAMACQEGGIFPWLHDIADDLTYFTRTEDDKASRIAFPRDELVRWVHPDDMDLLTKNVADLIKGSCSRVMFEFRSCYFKSDYIWYSFIGKPFEIDEVGKPLSLIGILRDISVEKLRQTDFSARVDAEQSDLIKSVMLANMSHEIRTPLNAIIGFSQLLMEDISDDEKKEYISIINKSDDQLLKIINNVVDATNVDLGQEKFVYTDFSVRDTLAPFKITFESRTKPGVSLIFDSTNIDCVIKSDHSRFMQVLSDLLSNAVKFTDKGSIHYGFSIENDYICVYVKDSGIGISEENKEIIFNRFVKLNTYTPGLGIGLSLCRSIIERLGGEIGLESQLGSGSTFWFTLPRISKVAVS